MRNLDLALIGNGRIGALLGDDGTIVWGCFPRFDGDPKFCALLNEKPDAAENGLWSIELVDGMRSEQSYVTNTAVLTTRLTDRTGGVVEITDCAPCFVQYGRLFQPMTIVRALRCVAGKPRVIVRLRPSDAYGRAIPQRTVGSRHVRYVGSDLTLRLTTDAPITAILEERPFLLEDPVTLLLGADESVTSDVHQVGRRFIEETLAYWRAWVRRLAIPFEWQDAVIRAAITLQLNTFDDTGAIIAAMTTSIPEAADSGRNWDYRYCWLRDSYFVVNALNRLGATETMENYLRYIAGIIAGVGDGPLQPVYRINGDAALTEQVEGALAGYRGMGPVRIGNDAFRQTQHDVYGAAILAATHSFFDKRLIRGGDIALFERLEPLGHLAIAVHDQPDAGIWEFRNTSRVHTFSSVMCWAACDRLARIAARSDYPNAVAWTAAASRIHLRHDPLLERASRQLRRRGRQHRNGREPAAAGRTQLHDAGRPPLRCHRRGHRTRTEARRLRLSLSGKGRLRHATQCVRDLHILADRCAGGHRTAGPARALFENLLARRSRHGLLAEHLDPVTGEAWGNFVQTYSMVGLINAAIRLSVPWEDAF